jgi:Na+/H+ antiporter NhaD/arsenite permease-like protein
MHFDWHLVVVGVFAVVAIGLFFWLRFRKSETSNVISLGMELEPEENSSFLDEPPSSSVSELPYDDDDY